MTAATAVRTPGFELVALTRCTGVSTLISGGKFAGTMNCTVVVGITMSGSGGPCCGCVGVMTRLTVSVIVFVSVKISELVYTDAKCGSRSCRCCASSHLSECKEDREQDLRDRKFLLNDLRRLVDDLRQNREIAAGRMKIDTCQDR